MNWFLRSQDFLIVVIVPLMVLTANNLIKNWKSVWDDNLTRKDQDLLMRTTVFLLLPIAVLLHETGHAVATTALGGRVVEFHYGLLWGFVVPEGNFTPVQTLLIYLSGNVVEIVIGLISLLASLCVTAPALITVLTYFGFWTIGSTIVLYPALSLAGMYGDWSAIYATPLTDWKVAIGGLHVLLVAGLAYCLYSESVRLRFVRRTNLTWDRAYCAVNARLASEPNGEDYLRLAWLFFEVGLTSLAQQIVTKHNLLAQNNADARFLQGLLWLTGRKMEQAAFTFEELLKNDQLSPDLAGRIEKALELCRQAKGKQ
jgi:hypothetical protein